MFLAQSNRRKRALQALLAAFATLFAAQLVFVRAAGQLSPSPLNLGLFALAPLGVSVVFVLLWHMSWFGPNVCRSRFTPRKPFFWLVAAGVTTFWLVFFALFVLGSGAAA